MYNDIAKDAKGAVKTVGNPEVGNNWCSFTEFTNILSYAVTKEKPNTCTYWHTAFQGLKLSAPMLVWCVFIFSFQIAHRIRTGVQGLGEACISLIQSGGAVQSRPKDPFSKKELADNCRHVAEKVWLDWCTTFASYFYQRAEKVEILSWSYGYGLGLLFVVLWCTSIFL